ncbi:uncharacterized protein LOC127680968 isoform X2 [Apodemus sylvaticus]|uniref:uncharacterized protein LOC127680968 isoform X2 n=1 Tax=Apodemus sylvaticus TaxID=10129 RepID=UPI0022439A3B|nr:uncharacterized protein LOC127680968 isoform X2 [Apodemus sylvaticus]
MWKPKRLPPQTKDKRHLTDQHQTPLAGLEGMAAHEFDQGAAMVDGTNVIWVEESLPPGMSMQKVELVALTKTLELGTSKKINSHMDNRLKALEWVRQQVWKQLWEAYSREVQHRFQFGDSVYIRHHCAENLESRWKSPYLVLLTILLSALMRPFVILLLLLTIGTCVTNWFIAFIRETYKCCADSYAKPTISEIRAGQSRIYRVRDLVL